MSAFGPAPIQPTAPGAVQASFIAQQAMGARVREKSKPQDADPPRRTVRDEVQIHDPGQADPVDPKPDAAEEWKYRRSRGHPQRMPGDQTPARRQADIGDGEPPRIDLKA